MTALLLFACMVAGMFVAILSGLFERPRTAWAVWAAGFVLMVVGGTGLVAVVAVAWLGES